MRYLVMAIIGIIILSGATCNQNITMSPENQRVITDELSNKRFFLKSSFYYGDFYGSPEVCLLSPRRFNETIYLEGIDGKPILPGEEKGIIPYNTEVLIERVEFPPANRPLLTPRFYPWVYLKVDKLSGYKSCIVVIRPNVVKREDFISLFNDIFSTENNESFLKTLSQEKREAIFDKKFIEGLTENEVYVIFGKPDSIKFVRDSKERLVIFDYQFFNIIFKDDKTYKLERKVVRDDK